MRSDKYLTPAQAAELAGTHENTATEWCKRFPGLATKVVGKGPSLNNRVIHPAAEERWCNSTRHERWRV